MALCFIVVLALASADITLTASSVCVYNDAAFVLHWKLQSGSASSSSTKSYPVWQSRCLDTSGLNVTAGATLQPVVSAVWGKTVTASQPVLFDPINASQVTYVCKGTTLDFSCTQEASPPPTAGNVTADIAQFLLGFTEGLGTEIGFAQCLSDVNKTYEAVRAVVDFFEAGFN